MSRADVLENAHQAVEHDPVLARLESGAYRDSLIVLRALRLGPTLEVAEAILRGERVPRSRLDPEWRGTYAL